MKPITLEEIEYASRILFNGDSTKFYDDIERKTGERVTAIQCLESKPIVACPGSGKTTVLLAKLIILACRMPFDDGKGICVLTHTNVAIDLIKEKLGAEASKLFAYPNFFGTIQSFVDKFLASPFCSGEYNSRIRYVDKEKVNYESKKFYYSLDFGKDGVTTLKNSLYRSGTRANDWAITSTADKNSNAIKLLSNLTINYIKEKIDVGLSGDTFRMKNSKSENARRDFEECVNFKHSLISNNLISFEDAYCLAEHYINKYSFIEDTFKERFKFVFVDEMQDTATHQSNIIDKLFKGNEKTIIQELGDSNQAIYDYDSLNGEWVYDENNCLHLTDSKRFGKAISSVVNPLKIKFKDPEINGLNSESTLAPHLIIFDETQADFSKNVLDKFGELILQNGLHNLEKQNFVAIGRVGKDKGNDKITLKSYLSGFEKDSVKSKEFYPTLIEYFQKELSQKKFNYSEQILNGVLHLLDELGYKNEVNSKKGVIHKRFTKSTLLDFLMSNYIDLYFEFKTLIADCGLLIKTGKACFNTEAHGKIIKFVNEKLLPLKNIEFKGVDDFITISDIVVEENKYNKQSKNYHYVERDGIIIPIKINTIHGEKGETHTATLYLETYYNKKYDSERIKEQLEGSLISEADSEEKLTATKLAYVAMSRPEKLLCFAVSSKRISKEYADEKLLPIGWKIILCN